MLLSFRDWNKKDMPKDLATVLRITQPWKRSTLVCHKCANDARDEAREKSVEYNENDQRMVKMADAF